MKMNLNINNYTYNLPTDRIAHYPLTKRDDSKLLVYTKGQIEHKHFDALPDILPKNTILFFNNTKVIPARLNFQKDTGADIEVFLLAPMLPSSLLADAMLSQQTCTWKCTIGNLKRWTQNKTLTKVIGKITLEAYLIDRENGTVRFTWNTAQSFAEIINQSGETPLPPYLNRKAENLDRERYQTIYSHHEGAVAAPTAGLHFTDDVFNALTKKGIEKEFVTLHVSAGTFQPIKVENAFEHVMHTEQITVTKKNINTLLQEHKFITPVGTTSMRTLESLYWYGVKLLHEENSEFTIHQTDPYLNYTTLPSKRESLQAVVNLMEARDIDMITGQSSIFIHPGYSFEMCDALITNFHQPRSTLILLVAAFVGDQWRNIYQQALENDYRFLSYGDSSLLIP